MITPGRAVPVLFLDLDGTVRKGHDELGRWVNGPDDVAVFPEAITQMRAWKAGGGRIAAVTNQGGIALGHVAPDQALAALQATDGAADGLFDVMAMCPHHPGAESLVSARCMCRKPKPGLLVQAITMLYARHRVEDYPVSMALMVGDRPEDEQAAAAADVDFVWAAEWRAGAAGTGS